MRKLFFILLIAALALPACSGSTKSLPTPAGPRETVTPLPDRPTPSADELELSDPTKTIEVKAGEDFTITVRTQPNPNYHWEMMESLDPNVVEYVWKDHINEHPNAQNSRGQGCLALQSRGARQSRHPAWLLSGSDRAGVGKAGVRRGGEIGRIQFYPAGAFSAAGEVPDEREYSAHPGEICKWHARPRGNDVLVNHSKKTIIKDNLIEGCTFTVEYMDGD